MMADSVNQAFSSENFSFRDLHSSNSSTRVVLRSMSLLNVFLNRKKTSKDSHARLHIFFSGLFAFTPMAFRSGMQPRSETNNRIITPSLLKNTPNSFISSFNPFIVNYMLLPI